MVARLVSIRLRKGYRRGRDMKDLGDGREGRTVWRGTLSCLTSLLYLISAIIACHF